MDYKKVYEFEIILNDDSKINSYITITEALEKDAVKILVLTKYSLKQEDVKEIKLKSFN